VRRSRLIERRIMLSFPRKAGIWTLVATLMDARFRGHDKKRRGSIARDCHPAQDARHVAYPDTSSASRPLSGWPYSPVASTTTG
jgi:hypothetical protein